jgi:hypothetical protein
MPLILKNIDPDKVEGEWHERTLFGETIGLKIRPKTETVAKKIREKFKIFENGVETIKEPDATEALYEYLLESFRGFVDESGAPKPVTLENKKAIIFMDVPVGEVNNWIWILGKAIEQGVGIYKEELKNS